MALSFPALGAVIRRVAAAGFIGVALAGCASTISATVTRYQQWPGLAQGDTYNVVPTAAQLNNLEYQAVADTVVAALGPTGLVQAQPGHKPRFTVHIDYATTMGQTTVTQYANPPYDGWFFGPSFGYYGGGWAGGGVFYTPPVVTVPVQVIKNTLTVRIDDMLNSGREVYRATAVNVSETRNLIQVAPYLAQALFDGFPGNNGQVITVNYPVGR
jgi:hypothetical protein